MNTLSQGDGTALTESLSERDLGQSLFLAEAQFIESGGSGPTAASFAAVLALAVSERDQGRPTVALDAMDRLWALRKERNLCVEILVILVMWTIDVQRFKQFTPTIPTHLIEDKHIKLLLARGFEHSGNAEAAINELAQVSDDDVSMIPSFRQLRHEAIASLSKKFPQAPQKLMDHLGSAHLDDRARRIYVATLQNSSSCDEFERDLIAMAFTGDVNNRIPIETIVNAMLSMTDDVENEKLTIALRFLVSWRLSDNADRVAKTISASRLRLHPDFIKSIAKLAELPNMNAWRGKADELSTELYRYGGDGAGWSLSRSTIQFREVSARAHVLGARSNEQHSVPRLPATRFAPSTDSRHIFIGFFGQLRYPEKTVPELSRYIDQQTDELRKNGWTFSYGFSTWNKVGTRLLQKSDPSIFAFERLPVFLGEMLAKEGATLVEDVMGILPSTIAYISGRSGPTQDVDKRYLESLSGKEIFCDVLDDAEFMKREGNLIANQCNGDINKLNQARMWNRIGAFRQLTKAAAARASVEVSHALIIRADLLFRHGSLRDVIASALDHEANSLSADDDPHANFIEGLGDRFIFCDRPAMARLFDGAFLMQAAASDPALSQAYLTRFSAHQFLDTILFENNTRVTRIPHRDLGFEIFRGRMALEDIVPYLFKDVPNMRTEIKVKLESILSSYTRR